MGCSVDFEEKKKKKVETFFLFPTSSICTRVPTLLPTFYTPLPRESQAS